VLALVGNDVVDLRDPDNARSFRRPGYVERVCGPAERESLAAARDPERLFWAYFAAKEAAYKLLTKLGESPGFAHRELEVTANLEWVCGAGRRLPLRVTRGEQFVHAVVTPKRVELWASVEEAEGDPSRDARRVLAGLVAALVQCAPADLVVERRETPGSWDGFGPPFVRRRGAVLDLDVSLSHDGRFVAAAAAEPRPAPPALSRPLAL
jgi:hypothetical protein